MCYYDRTRFLCGCRTWSELRRLCDEARQSGEECGVKRVRKHIVDPEGRSGCLECQPGWVPFVRAVPQTQSDTEELTPLPLCIVPECFLPPGHAPPHVSWSPCITAGCNQPSGHALPHTFLYGALSRNHYIQLEQMAKEALERLERLNLLVLSAMGVGVSEPAGTSKVKDKNRQQSLVIRPRVGVGLAPTSTAKLPKQHVLGSSTTTTRSGSASPYLKLNFSSQQIRLFELYPGTEASNIECSFRCIELSACPAYTALSYTWGDQTACRQVKVDDGGTISLRENLWWFLRLQSFAISRPKLFWIDAICINQSNIHERNHQVGLMKQIYVNATEVYVWLGREANNSDVAMEFVAKKGARNLRPRGPGFHPVWSRAEGRALCDLCERPYWRRMWIIQEIIHAEKITVWCGMKSFEWGAFESLYLTLKTLEDAVWFAHHEFLMGVLQSSAGVMVWQRAHWRHPETPTPRLQTLIDVFRDWQCADVRDKVYALVSMASSNTAIVPDYSQSARQVFFAVQEKDGQDKAPFYNLLSQVLGLPGKDLRLPGQDL
jgi:hypothetical protein